MAKGNPTIKRQSDGSPTRASFAQERMWLLEQLDPQSGAYNQLNGFRLRGMLDCEILKRSLLELLDRHRVLASRLVLKDGQLFQEETNAQAFDLPLVDLSSMPDGKGEDQAKALAREQSRAPFDLARGMLFRATLFRLSPQDHLLAITTHHSAFDGWSLGVMLRDLAGIYEAFSKGLPSPLPELPIQYQDYALWQRELYERGEFAAQESYWVNRLCGDLPALELPLDHPRPAVQSMAGSAITTTLDVKLTSSLKEVSRRRGTTLFMTLLAAYKVLLHRWTGQEKLIVGCPIAGRTRRELEPLIGLFINTLPIRTDLSGDPPFSSLLGQVRQNLLEAYSNQDVPFDKLVEIVKPERHLSSTPIFQTIFQLRNFPLRNADAGGLRMENYEFDFFPARVDLTVEITEIEGTLHCRFEYCIAILDRSTIERMVGAWRTLLEGITMDPDQRISELPLLTPEEKRQILEGWNRTSHDYPRDETVPGRFEEQVARSPSSVALVYGRTSLTYGDLNARANGLALQLTKAGFMPGSAAVILMDRRPELPITHLAILKAGGICVPMNPTDPKDRIALVLKDTSAPLLLTSKDHSEQLPQGSAKIIFVEDSLLGSNPNEANFSNRPTVPSTAYIIYTSGSMGTPKGVCIPHRAILRTAINNSFVEFLPADTVASVTNPAFDVSLGELWGALLNGARIAIFDREITLSPSAFVARVRETGVKVMFTTPTLLNLMVREVPTAFLGIRDLITGGEVLDPSLAKEILAGSKPGRLINVYGPTEGTVLSTWHVVKDVAEDSPIPIGRPIANTQAYILDKNLQPVPVGVRGELYLGGDGLSSGYYNRPELTAAAFLPNPFSGDPSSKIFRTGDICRYLHDGNIEFVGRSDLQVKIRGFRIELGEIEAMLGRHPAVKTAVAVVWGEGQADRRLVAYVSPIPNATIDPSQLKDYLKGLLPDYMIPSAIMVLPELPLMPNGKVDRRALPPPEPPRTGRSEADAMAHSHEELELIEMWEDLLRVKPIGVNDNFFDLGGHSMMAVRLFARIEEKFKVRMPLATLFQSPTIKELAKVLRAKEPSQLGDLLVPLQGSGSGSPLFLLHAADGDVLNYTAFVRSYGPGRPIYGIQSRGINGEAQPLTSIEEMGTQYVHAVQKIRPHGPYLLLGYSEGALPAYEMARQFAEAGEEVGLLAIIDASTPGQKESEAATRRREFVVEFLNLYVDIRQAIPKGNLRDLIRTFPQRIANLILYGLQAVGFQRKSAEPLLPGWAFYLSEARKRTIIANIKAAKAYRPKKYQGVVTLYRQTPFPMLSTLDPQMGWQRLAREVDSTTISGYIHGNMLKPPQVAKLVLDLKKRVDAVDGPQNV